MTARWLQQVVQAVRNFRIPTREPGFSLSRRRSLFECRHKGAPRRQAEAGLFPHESHPIVDHQEGPHGNLLGIGGDRAER